MSYHLKGIRRRSFILFTAILFFSFSAVHAQSLKTSTVTRILFVLDASGSMKGEWNGTSKFELAKKILSSTVDSVIRNNPRVEFALRAFGEQSPRSANNCRDTKLEVPFSKKNGAAISERLNQIVSQGQTPIEFTLLQAMDDFPLDSLANNAIILITDGNETCNGNFCDLNSKFREKRIALRPFIVGLGLSDSLKKKFDCLGSFFDVQNEDALAATMKVVISRVLNRTSCQINLLDAYGNPTETNIEMTLYDHATKNIRYNFIHTMNAAGIPDTLFLDPRITYDLTVHSVPEVAKEGIVLATGTHNIIAIPVPMGTLTMHIDGSGSGFSNVPCIVRRQNDDGILKVQDAGTSSRYLMGIYNLEILTLPPTFLKDIKVEEAKNTVIKIARAGTLIIVPSNPGEASLFVNASSRMKKVYDYNIIKSQQTLTLQPGKYTLIYRSDEFRSSGRTKRIAIEIYSGKTTAIRL